MEAVMSSVTGTYDTQKAKEINLSEVSRIMRHLGCKKVYIKKLAPNDNSKNQPYFGKHLTDLTFLPTKEIIASVSTSNKTKDPKRKIKYQAELDFSWVDPRCVIYPAPNAKLIYYPQYPEVRFSGFLARSKVSISEWMSPDKQGRSLGRWLILGVNRTSETEKIYAYLATPESNLSKELSHTKYVEISSVFWQPIIDNTPELSTRDALINKLRDIHQMGWIPSQKLNPDMTTTPYKAQNGGGYTLEAMLGVVPNGVAEPDYLGWEVKQFGVTRFPRVGTKPTTLMTPEPNGGFYVDSGAIEFVKTYGYPDKSGKPDRLNFGGKHIVGKQQNLTLLTMQLTGFNVATSSITDAEGGIELVDQAGNITASWSFAKLMNHWKNKHSQAVYVPCMKQLDPSSKSVSYHYGKDIELGVGTNFEMILAAMNLGTVFYDPGIKLEQVSSPKPKIKRRSQFRANHKDLNSLYKQFDFIDVEST
jgi:hypothetical protein